MPALVPTIVPTVVRAHASVGRAGISERSNAERSRRQKNFQAFDCHYRLHAYIPATIPASRIGARRFYCDRLTSPQGALTELALTQELSMPALKNRDHGSNSIGEA